MMTERVWLSGPQDLLLCRAPPSEPLTRFGLLQRLSGPLQASRHGPPARVVAQVVHWRSGARLARPF